MQGSAPAAVTDLPIGLLRRGEGVLGIDMRVGLQQWVQALDPRQQGPNQIGGQQLPNRIWREIVTIDRVVHRASFPRVRHGWSPVPRS